MDPAHWQRIQELLAAARSLRPEDREEFVRERCAGDPALLDDVLSLLEADAKPGVHDSTATISSLRALQLIAGRFRILRHVGHGGMGDVYEAEDLELHDRVALKTIRPPLSSDSRAIEQFKREILLGKRITHPNVCRVHDLGSERCSDGTEIVFLTMQFLEGESLSARIKRGRLSDAEARPIVRDLAAALAAAHRAQVVHRDFKSGNVMLVPGAERPVAVVTDFGLARSLNRAGPSLANSGAIAGTVDYMAPEQIRGGTVGAAADIYAFGVVICEMLTGRRPFAGDSAVQIALQHLHDPPPRPSQFVPDLDPAWEGVILRCLKKAPEERFASVEDVAAALEPGAPAVNDSTSAIRRSLVTFAVAALLILALVLLPWRKWTAGSNLLPAQKRIAVLKFGDIGGDALTAAFRDGLMEVLTSKLTGLEQFRNSLSVIPAADVRKEKIESAGEARRDFGANLVITGSVARSGSVIRLIVNVIDADRLRQLRSREMTISESDPLAMQDGVTQQVADLLDLELHPEEQRRSAEGSTPVPGAYDFYLQGQGYLLAGRGSIDQSIVEFRHALDLDPKYALAYAGLGEAYWRKYGSTEERHWVDDAWAQARRAVELNPRLAATHLTLAILNGGTGHSADAIRECREAIRIDPTSHQAYAELAHALEQSGNTQEAEATLRKAIELRPDYWNNYLRLGSFCFRHGRYHDAETLYRRVIELVPDNPAGYTNLGVICHLQGRESEAEQALRKSLQLKPTPQASSNLATVYFFEGRYADAVPVLEQLVAAGTRNYVIWGNLGDAYRWAPGYADKAPAAFRTAIGLIEQALAVNPRDSDALSSRALYEAKLGRIGPALAFTGKALAAASDDKNVLFGAAIVYEIAGKRQDALAYLDMAKRGGYSTNEIAAEPELRKLRADPRYGGLLALQNR